MLRDKTIPLYYQLETILRRKIVSGEFAQLSLLPGEEALASEYEVSRITVRQAMASLERDGLVIRQRGRGTFVSRNAVKVEPPHFIGSIEDLLMLTVRTSFKVLSSAWVDPPDHIREKLCCDKAQVLRVEKIRLLEGRPFSHVFNYLPDWIGEKLPLDLAASKPMLMVLEENLGVRPVEADQIVSASIADAQIAGVLQIRAGDPLLQAERTVYDQSGRPVEYVTVLYRADKYSFKMKLKRKQKGNKNGWDPV